MANVWRQHCNSSAAVPRQHLAWPLPLVARLLCRALFSSAFQSVFARCNRRRCKTAAIPAPGSIARAQVACSNGVPGPFETHGPPRYPENPHGGRQGKASAFSLDPLRQQEARSGEGTRAGNAAHGKPEFGAVGKLRRRASRPTVGVDDGRPTVDKYVPP